jgi:heme-degrading monooxygenase HmoA
MTVNSELDELLSNETPVVETVEAQPIVEQTTTAPARGDDGRFQAKQNENPAPDASLQPSATPDEPAANGGVPVRAVQDEREKRQAAQQENAALLREIAEMRGQLQVLTTQRQPQTKQEEQRPISLWDDPDAFLQGQLSPVQSQLQEMREELWESKAAVVHTPEAVQAAKAAAEKLFGTPEGKVLHQQITSAGGNPFDNLVKWHKQQETLSRVGNDPEAWLNAEMERRLSDPAEQAKIMERIRSGAPSTQTNGKPITNFAPSLSRLPSGGNQAQDNDMSDGALFNFATSR